MADQTEVALPLDSNSVYYSTRTVMDDVTYVFDVRWNDVEQAWYFDLKDTDESMIVADIKIVLGCALGGRCQDARMPPGVMWAVDLSKQQLDATISDLGTRVLVYYYPVSAIP